ncbi:MAG: hypothetical protein D6715_03060 [Calditrichaeota bacterium]|nr:MAG: hypothetical protein D6715_03060 [Calditrichota bacterium]
MPDFYHRLKSKIGLGAKLDLGKITFCIFKILCGFYTKPFEDGKESGKIEQKASARAAQKRNVGK